MSALESIVFQSGSTNFDNESSTQSNNDRQRTGRKSLTTVTGLAFDLDLKKILKALKKSYSTNGTIINDPEVGEVVQLQGDQRRNVYEFLVNCNIVDKDLIKVHGF
jgi:translation initiation factor 1